ncbi:hypothetical protein ACTHP2_14905 [Bacillus altitudinis]|uniref:hypothetical protein n=1 Tax=Bacillus altitudinis TaxID=293387 RepID=UPI00227E77F0|nr:hypothetical protein [Bacillus altitudinis]MCY7631254.1 hypothetical protein [Bacillus altitudinis]MDX2366005.1 hypothetical protein [Bacillus altitudinis]
MDCFCKDENITQTEQEELLKMLNPLIKKCLYNISYQEREDFEQDIKLKLLDKFNLINDQEVPGFWEFAVQQEKQNKS